MRRQEQSELHVTIFNYNNETLRGNLTVTENGTKDGKLSFNQCDKGFILMPNEIKIFTCTMNANHVGSFDVIAEALVSDENMNITKFDGEVKQLKVIYEGFVEQKVKSFYFDLTSEESNHLQEVYHPVFPEERIKGSEMLLLSANTELITVTWLNQLDKIQRDHSNVQYDFSDPDGCCQQILGTHYPKLHWLEYLNMTKKATKNDFENVVRGIQRVLANFCKTNPFDGSYIVHYNGL